MNKLDKIRQLREMNTQNTPENHLKRRERLRKLVKKHGFDAVAEASGWRVSSISQYLRNSSPMISESKLSQAEEILASI